MDILGRKTDKAKPPLTRRWTHEYERLIDRHEQTSAHAEMDPWRATLPAPLPPNLRSRGDGPEMDALTAGQGDKPPLTRRWTRMIVARHVDGEQTSAHAEMDPLSGYAGRSPPPNLRSRGDGPFCSQPGIARSCKPPLTRRWTSASRSPPWTCTQTSAHAEMDLPLALSRLGQLANLRSRGDGPHSRFTTFRSSSKPPLTRRWTYSMMLLMPKNHQTSAHAEMDLQSVKPSAVKATNLRSRGDGPYQTLARAKQASKPPLTRRWTSEEPVWISRSEQTSAHAEMDREGLTGHARSVPNLRTRGDGLLKATAARAA